MEAIRKADPDVFAKKLIQARACALLLDYDGTLAPFSIERDRALPYPGVTEVLTQIVAPGNTRLVIVTGRPAKEVPPLLGLGSHGLEVWGCDGWERLGADGSYQVTMPEPQAQEGVAVADSTLVALGCGRFRHVLNIDRDIERKVGGLAVHWRRYSSEVTAMLHDGVTKEWTGLTRDAGLELSEFEEGLELRVPGRSKAAVVESILRETNESVPMAPVAYLGTDEDAFLALNKKGGLSVLVCSKLHPTAADLWLNPPQGVFDFLWLWAELRSRRV